MRQDDILDILRRHGPLSVPGIVAAWRDDHGGKEPSAPSRISSQCKVFAKYGIVRQVGVEPHSPNGRPLVIWEVVE